MISRLILSLPAFMVVGFIATKEALVPSASKITGVNWYRLSIENIACKAV